MKRLLLPLIAGVFAAFVVAGPASAHREQSDGVSSKGSDHGARPASTSGPSESSAPSGPEASEATGAVTVSADGTAVTVTTADGSSISCAVPAGVDLTPFLTGDVKAECESVDGVLTLRELESQATGAKVEVGDDGTIEAKGEDGEDVSADDHQGDDSEAQDGEHDHHQGQSDGAEGHSGSGNGDDENGGSSGSGGGDD